MLLPNLSDHIHPPLVEQFGALVSEAVSRSASVVSESWREDMALSPFM